MSTALQSQEKEIQQKQKIGYYWTTYLIASVHFQQWTFFWFQSWDIETLSRYYGLDSFHCKGRLQSGSDSPDVQDAKNKFKLLLLHPFYWISIPDNSRSLILNFYNEVRVLEIIHYWFIHDPTGPTFEIFLVYPFFPSYLGFFSLSFLFHTPFFLLKNQPRLKEV